MADDLVLTSFEAEAFAADYSRRLVEEMLRVETALARAQANIGLIEQGAASSIESFCEALARDLSPLDVRRLKEEALKAGNFAIPFVKRLTTLLAEKDPQAAKVLHLGATSQDILDTAAILVWQRYLDAMQVLLYRAMQRTAEMTRSHRNTPMVGRTWMQHALPMTLGLKTAGWLDALMRHSERLRSAREQILVLQFGGATGTLASLGPDGTRVSAAMANLLGLTEPAMPWFGHRDRIFELASTLVGTSGTLGKIAKDVSLMAQREVAEVTEGGAPGRGGSSTMPHKRNPVRCAIVLTQTTVLPGLLASLASGLPQEHERALGGWQAEWKILPEILQCAGLALDQTLHMLEELEISPAVMRNNIDRSRGLIMAEAVAMALAKKIGKSEAHELLEIASRQAVRENKSLQDVLIQTPEVLEVFRPHEIEKLLAPASYMGSSLSFVDRVLHAYGSSYASGHS